MKYSFKNGLLATSCLVLSLSVSSPVLAMEKDDINEFQTIPFSPVEKNQEDKPFHKKTKFGNWTFDVDDWWNTLISTPKENEEPHWQALEDAAKEGHEYALQQLYHFSTQKLVEKEKIFDRRDEKKADQTLRIGLKHHDTWRYSLQLITKESVDTIKTGELGIFSEDNDLYCKVKGKKEMKILKIEKNLGRGLNPQSFDRIINALKENKSITEEDQETLFQFTLSNDYTSNWVVAVYKTKLEKLEKENTVLKQVKKNKNTAKSTETKLIENEKELAQLHRDIANTPLADPNIVKKSEEFLREKFPFDPQRWLKNHLEKKSKEKLETMINRVRGYGYYNYWNELKFCIRGYNNKKNYWPNSKSKCNIDRILNLYNNDLLKVKHKIKKIQDFL